jgi:hypothetical protein
MNVLEKEMVQVLLKLKQEYAVFEVKAEFEAEGSRMEELMRLKDITSAVGLPIILKTGGVEAVTDMYNGLALGVKGLIAPMAETAFALSKFIGAIKSMLPSDNVEDIEFAFNMETIMGYKNLDDMLALPDVKVLSGMTIGRVDLTGSMFLARSAIDSESVFEICQTAFRKAKAIDLKTGLGGAISTSSIDFIMRLNEERLVDKFETRKVVFPADAIRFGDAAILLAIEFELLWLKSKRRYYSGIRAEDEHRIAMLEKRLALSRG